MADAEQVEHFIHMGCRFVGVLPNGKVVLEKRDPNPSGLDCVGVTSVVDKRELQYKQPTWNVLTVS